MTTIQSMMLSVCFGAVLGTLIAEVVFIIQHALGKHREKRRKRIEKEKSAEETE